MARFRCRLGLHRWQFQSRVEREPRGRREYNTYARCWSPECREHRWRMVDTYALDTTPLRQTTGVRS